MVPVARRPKLIGQHAMQLFAHVDDAASHRADIRFPLLEEFCIV